MNASGPEILFEVFYDLNIITDPEENKPWVGFINTLPDKPNEAVAFFDSSTETQGRIQKTGETIAFHEVQIRVRSTRSNLASKKMKEIEQALDEILKYEVSVDEERYLVHATHRMNTSVYIGQDESDRDSFVVDCRFYARKITN